MAKLAFNHCSLDYARFRPPYPQRVFDVLTAAAANTGPRRAADVGAGTGIFSRELAKRGWNVLAIEPSRSMLAHLTSRGPTQADPIIHGLRATAEATALQEASVSLVTCAQAFHWFNPPVALREFGRILVDGGVLAMVWNLRDERDPFVRSFHDLITAWNPNYRHEYRDQDWAAKVAESALFEPLTTEIAEFAWLPSQQDFIGFTRSVSYIRNVLATANRRRFETALRALLHAHFGSDACSVPLRTEISWARRRGRIRPI